MALTSAQVEANQLMVDRFRLLDQANTLGIDLAKVEGETVDEEWEQLEYLVDCAFETLKRLGEMPPRSTTGKPLKQKRRRRDDGQ